MVRPAAGGMLQRLRKKAETCFDLRAGSRKLAGGYILSQEKKLAWERCRVSVK